MENEFFQKLGLAGSIVLLVLGFLLMSGGLVSGMMMGISLFAILATVVAGAAVLSIGTTGVVINARNQ